MNKSSAEVEQEFELSRSQLDRNVEALKDKMTPGQLLDEAMHSMGGAGQQVASRFFEQAKQNPMPLAVMGLGIAWLMASNNSGGSGGGRSEPRSFGSGSGIGDRAGGLADAAKDKAQGIADQASSAMDAARDKLSGGSAAVKESLSGAADKASDLTQRARQGVSQAFESEPLLGGALGLFIGLAIGAALPSTEAEDRLMGRTRDGLIDKGKDLAQTGIEQASSAAKSAYEGAKSELQSDGGGEIADKLASAVRTGVERAQAELNPPGPRCEAFAGSQPANASAEPLTRGMASAHRGAWRSIRTSPTRSWAACWPTTTSGRPSRSRGSPRGSRTPTSCWRPRPAAISSPCSSAGCGRTTSPSSWA